MKQKKVSIQNIVDREIKKFADSYEARFIVLPINTE